MSKVALANGSDSLAIYNGITLYGSLQNKSVFEVQLHLKRTGFNPNDSDFYCGENCNFDYWGVDGYKPVNLIDKLQLRIDDTEILIPKDALRDLTNINLPSGVYLTEYEKTINLYLKGGDGSGSYTAVFKIIDSKLVSRIIKYLNSDGVIESISTNY